MTRTLIIADDFAPDPMALRERVLASKFGTELGPDGLKYDNVGLHPEPILLERVEDLVGRKIVPRIACFRLHYAKELPSCFCHSDQICAQWAGIYYMNLPEQCQGGTAFWRHKTLHIDRMPNAEECKAMNESPMDVIPRIIEDWKNPSEWEQCGFVGMKFNRFATYSTKLFHSRWPQSAFGTTPETARLIWTLFYDLK